MTNEYHTEWKFLTHTYDRDAEIDKAYRNCYAIAKGGAEDEK